MDGIYRNPATNDTLTLDDAVKYGLISGQVLDTKRKTEERILDSTNIVATSIDGSSMDNGQHSHESSLHVSQHSLSKAKLSTYLLQFVAATNNRVSKVSHFRFNMFYSPF